MPKAKRVAHPIHETLAFHLNISTKTQAEIAKEVGYDKPNILSMFKLGHTKIPLEVAPKLAKAVGLDPWSFVERCLVEYEPELHQTVHQTFGTALTENEREILRLIREATDGQDPAIKTKAQARALVEFARSLV